MDNYKTLNTYGEQMKIPDIFQNVGYAHNSTLQTTQINKEKVQSDFMKYHDTCVQFRKRFDSYMDEFEQRRYMSPVELLICTHYRDIDYLFNVLFNRIEQFSSEISEINEWKYCRCYGHKNIKHLLVNGHLYQNSHENFYHGNAVMDVATMLNVHTELFEWDETKLTEHFSFYLKVNELEQVELYLLGIYLLDPTEYFQIVEDYATNARKRPMIEQIIILKQIHRRLIHLMSWANKNLTLENTDTD